MAIGIPILFSILSMIGLTVLGNLLMKLGADHGVKVFGFFSWMTILGMFIFGLGAIIYAWLLQKMPLNVVQVFLSLQYVAVIIASYYILSEPISALKWFGISLIFVGFLVASRA
ncbi:MAG: EamA family transporter [Alphaproteobacteria bacterium]|jgi:drug/metabolite transporter (DMT)-like permease|nr:EamA family transporter [Alphaproteobacteria bacterium]MBT5389554.1 EamA family transporter [Alphaproteobacteria bacterium]MBT5655190.1 EamA family transporter [Alphaproteobacteria bacterium]